MKIKLAIAGLSVLALALGGCSDDPSGSPSNPPSATLNTNTISILIGSSGQAETDAVKKAAADWSTLSGIPTEVIVASDLNQEAAQGFASGQPADLLYVSTDSLAGWTANGSLEAYGSKLSNLSDFYPGLREAFTIDGTLIAAPKDFSTLALVINTRLWEEAGLSDADYPTTWEQLESVAAKLTTDGRVGLAFGAELQRVGVFLAQNGGSVVANGTATANSSANVAALTYVQNLVSSGSAAFAADIGAGWGGEALGKELAAMVIEGNWITGAMSSDYSDVAYKAVELPAGVQKGTLQFTNAWGLSADGDNKDNAIKLVEFLTSTDQQLAFAKAFGVMPSVISASDGYRAQFPQMSAFLLGADYAQNLPSATGVAATIVDFNSTLGQLKDSDPKALLDAFQTNLEAALG
ncbi:MAG: extracellular solute-binding protein [Propionibacteriaceae bacterium]|jgi:multiple sugar transport system substrate-binding protein|nr:extracellular solute-binding protein [Propionibacteriaceae bacterium]